MDGRDFTVLAVLDAGAPLSLVESGGRVVLMRGGPGGPVRVRLRDFLDSEETAGRFLGRWSRDCRRTPDERAAAERCLREAGLSDFA